MRTHGQICVRMQILYICKICIRMQIWSCVHGFSLNIFILNFNVTCNTNIHTIIIYRIGTEAHSLLVYRVPFQGALCTYQYFPPEGGGGGGGGGGGAAGIPLGLDSRIIPTPWK